MADILTIGITLIVLVGIGVLGSAAGYVVHAFTDIALILFGIVLFLTAVLSINSVPMVTAKSPQAVFGTVQALLASGNGIIWAIFAVGFISAVVKSIDS